MSDFDLPMPLLVTFFLVIVTARFTESGQGCLDAFRLLPRSCTARYSLRHGSFNPHDQANIPSRSYIVPVFFVSWGSTAPSTFRESEKKPMFPSK